MNEEFLYYIWKYQKYDNTFLSVPMNEKLVVFNPGHHNQDAGPDFEEARVKIGSIEWVGNVEIHVKSSDWLRHKHSQNRAYDSVILHVVWENDKVITINGAPIPTLELKGHVNNSLIETYKEHINSVEPIACASQDTSKLALHFASMLDKVLVERLEQKAAEVFSVLNETINDWEEACYRVLLRNFGFSTNKQAFDQLAVKLPYAILKKNLDQRRIEALLFGQAGFLSKPVDSYSKSLKEEHAFLAKKHCLPYPMVRHEWKFSKIRPANFPTLRIAQLAALINHVPGFFSSTITLKNASDIHKIFQFELSPYWNKHYDFGKRKRETKNPFGKTTKDHLIINTIVPILAAYSKFTDNQRPMELAIELLEQTPSEKNRIINHWISLGKVPKSAFESQAELQLYKEYCQKRKCLSCTVGVSLLNK